MLTKVSTDKAPAAIGPYSQGIIAGDFLFASGQIPIDPATGEIKGNDVTEQAEQAMKNVGAILAEAGTDYTKVVKTTCFLAEMADFAAFNAVYESIYREAGEKLCCGEAASEGCTLRGGSSGVLKVRKTGRRFN